MVFQQLFTVFKTCCSIVMLNVVALFYCTAITLKSSNKGGFVQHKGLRLSLEKHLSELIFGWLWLVEKVLLYFVHFVKMFLDQKTANLLNSFVFSTRVTRRLEKNSPNFRLAPKVAKSKKGQNVYNKTQFESPKHIHQNSWNFIIPKTNHV